ncbi:hypothetical protein AVEN_105363-1 [Araneus ventricosus]|uniref:Uncharacterized protein n=1 Tax=Araneus ventricosus TaxID=182803 RepID=A0A4Y2VUF1_ARAVE|nr:hypothetical protein AVEN_259492-1 [Araneus ventricosus]GBO27407.1 hypothetical protein AVEN_105363-1 [Araneus ventricosus]
MCQPSRRETAKGFKKCGYVPMGGWGSDESCDRWARAVTRCRNTWEGAKTHNGTSPATCKLFSKKLLFQHVSALSPLFLPIDMSLFSFCVSKRQLTRIVICW